MRIMGFTQNWEKLRRETFTTFRFERKDQDWNIDEIVAIKIKPRSKGGGTFLGTAKIVNKENRDGGNFITDKEAVADGFKDKTDMWKWMLKSHRSEQLVRPLNKLTLERIDGFIIY